MTSSYPVFIPTLNRYGHFRACVESLSRCTRAAETELVVGLDYPPSEKYVEGWRRIREYLPTISGFNRVTVFEQTSNIGPTANFNVLIKYCFEHYKACIFSEDDNVLAAGFLDYTNKALERFADNPRIVSVCGYSQQACECSDKCRAYLTYDSCAWGMGLWRDKEAVVLSPLSEPGWVKSIVRRPMVLLRILFTYPILLVMFLRGYFHGRRPGGDVMRTVYNFANRTYQLRPAKSLVRNCGQDGAGLHCAVNSAASQQKISEAATFDFGDKPPRLRTRGMFWQGTESIRLVQWLRRHTRKEPVVLAKTV